MPTRSVKIKSFENCLDEEFEKLMVFQYNRFECIEAVGVIHEIALHKGLLRWSGAIDVLIPKLLTNIKGTKRELPADAAIRALEFSQNYYFLRDYFFFTYNLPGTMKWTFPEKAVNIKLLDDTFQLQKFLEMNHWFTMSQKAFVGFDEIKRHIKDNVDQTTQEFVESDSLKKAFEGCIKEAEIKLNTYPNFLDDDFVFDSYSIGDFKAVYKVVLARALLRRYFVQKYEKNNVANHGWILAPKKEELVKGIVEFTEISEEKVSAILNDLTLDTQKTKKGHGISSFPLIFDSDENCYLLFPNSVCLCECYDSLRRAWAMRNPELYGARVANAVGDAMATRIESIFKANGFTYVKRNIDLRQFGERLPDIDVLALRKESGFGYVLFLCETKNTLPEQFGKDFVRSISSTGFVTEAKKQVEDICEALKGTNFIDLLKKSFPDKKWEYGLYALYSLIITSQNNGVFVKGKTILDLDTFDQIVSSSKGDILLVVSRIKQDELLRACKKCSKIVYETTQIGEYSITFPVIGFKKILRF